jgi:hypothetical protein
MKTKAFNDKEIAFEAGISNLEKGSIKSALIRFRESGRKYRINEIENDLNPSKNYTRGLAVNAKMNMRDHEKMDPCYNPTDPKLTGEYTLNKLNKNYFLNN